MADAPPARCADRTPTLRVEEIPVDWQLAILGNPPTVMPVLPYADPGDRAWLFLDYGDWQLGRWRWLIHARKQHEDLQLVATFGSTHERALDLIPKEIELAKDAIALIRAEVAR